MEFDNTGEHMLNARRMITFSCFKKVEEQADSGIINMRQDIYYSAMVFCCLIFLTSGCTKRLLEKKCLGKPISPKFSEQLMELQMSGHHRFDWQNMDITYDYQVDPATQSITFEGIMQYNLSKDESKWKSETVLLKYKTFIIVFIFADPDETIVGVEVKDMPTGIRILDPVSFKVTVPYQNQYKFAVASYSAYATEEGFMEEKGHGSLYLEEIVGCDYSEEAK